MENKNMIIIFAAVAVVIIAIAGILFATGFIGGNDVETTPFKMSFMEGSFIGNVSLENDKEKFMHSYEDKENKITYNISTVDNSSVLMEIYQIQGLGNPEVRSFNGNEWNIYFTQAVPNNNSSTNSSNGDDAMNIIIGESQGKKQGYLIYMIIDGKSKINATGKMYGEAYTNYFEPLLESLTLKESKNVPHIYDEFGLTKEQFDYQIDLIRQYKSGNTSALQGAQ
ncbi:hypothetical protein SAMN05216439_0329 [Methanobrevibacter gottschalkii]|uniref:Uncharacterized protein n=2 Tax=Methanobrevibacter gottschalkii TaxID=190974 RepID=A0A3N5B3E8_9EURY|nr:MULTISPECIES: hypothetical protein [Methanobrevibacter]MCQ2970273.1 hypothetical protein [archaeon]OEC95716.1 hypothetical protein A9505_07160 [Methanobrevibacter sp. A27]RPF51914.1 hypothetical protein EDC42_1256 [Methanobrevibacter gottschalkii DSM 11977]SEL30841.1 hypothetical protein SAMN05216439_0329 [Methanobrevibacter gottschalkii]